MITRKRILITGAGGQIGSELTMALRSRYETVVAAGFQVPLPGEIADSGPCIDLDVCDFAALRRTIAKHKISTIYHLAGILSAVAEKKPQLAWQVNVDGLRNVLEAAKEAGCSVFFPSSIGAFGPQAPANNTPQDTIQRPSTIYGITKVCGEMLCNYYFKHFKVDTRGLRFPGLISYTTPPGGGTTDYAVEIFYAAVADKPYQCFLRKGTYLDMMYMPDALRATIELMEADPRKLIHRNAYNITAMSFAPEELYAAIKKHKPHFKMTYKVDPVRQAIADSWPNKLNDHAAKAEWGWKVEYHLAKMTRDMLAHLSKKLEV